MAAAEPRIIGGEEEVEQQQQRVVEGGLQADDDAKAGRGRGHGPRGPATTVVPPPHAWLAIEDTVARKTKNYDSDPEEDQWALMLRDGVGDGGRQQRRRSSSGVVRRERAAREAWLDRAWEMKRSWHERNGGAPDAGTPVVVVVGKAPASPLSSSAGAPLGGGVAMDMEEVRACRDLGLELPADCTVEIQCFGLSGGSSPTHTASSAGSGDSPSCSSISTLAADPVDVKARLKVWAQAVALASTAHLGS